MLRIHQRKLVGIAEGSGGLLDVKDVLYIDTADKHTFLLHCGGVYECVRCELYELEEGLREQDSCGRGAPPSSNSARIRSIRPDMAGGCW